MKRERNWIYAVLAAVLLMGLSGCGLMKDAELPDIHLSDIVDFLREDEPDAGTAPAENTPAPAPENAGEPAGQTQESAVENAVVFRGGDVTVTAESLDQTDDGVVFTISLEHGRAEAVTWTLQSVTLDGFSLPVNADVSLGAGETARYQYTVDKAAAALFMGRGEHTVSLRSAVYDAAGTLLSEYTSDAVSVSMG